MIPTVRDHLRERDPARLLVTLIVAIATCVGLVYYVKGVSQLGDSASSNSSLGFADREIAGGNSILVDQRTAYEARGLIPEDGTYRVVVGPNLRERTELTETYVSGWFMYFLMPRRPRETAPWVICYGCDTSTLGGSYELRWHDDKGISIGRVH
jgi:hypothetical protein